VTGALFPEEKTTARVSRTGSAVPMAWPDWPFGDLAPASFDVIMADPPWAYQMRGPTGYERSPQAHYDCLDLDALRALPVGRLAAPDCLLWMWTTWPFLANGAALDLIRAWGFEGKTGLPWVKTTVNGNVAFGTGYVLRSCSEPVIIATRGAPTYDKQFTRRTRALINAMAREHSRKPDDAYAMCERMIPAARRLDLFAREPRDGWSVWGNQTNRFEERAGSASVTALGPGGASAVAAHQDLLGPARRHADGAGIQPQTGQADIIAKLIGEAGRVFP
jgi:N6-adenosine-specific RNA methylase IME4